MEKSSSSIQFYVIQIYSVQFCTIHFIEPHLLFVLFSSIWNQVILILLIIVSNGSCLHIKWLSALVFGWRQGLFLDHGQLPSLFLFLLLLFSRLEAKAKTYNFTCSQISIICVTPPSFFSPLFFFFQANIICQSLLSLKHGGADNLPAQTLSCER